ncbi:MAG: tyrosine-protein phosphatase [Bacilli bacterium]|nr:tyrosine-protein phosphatase [Bacilli bacterium]
MKNVLIRSAIFLSALSLVACTSGNGSLDKVSSEAPVVDPSGFKNVNDEEPFEIHTELQKAFLEYDGTYAQCPADLYPDGTAHLSDSNPFTLTWNYEAKEEKEVSSYSVIFGQNPDLSDGYRVDGTTEESITFSNPFLGTNYYKLIATYADGATDESLIHTFEVNSQYPRNLTISGMTNCRDMGGRVTEDGTRIKQGMLYRTSGRNQNGSLTDATTEEMINHLGVKNEINLAGDSDSYNLKLEGTTLITSCKMDTSSTGGFHHFSRNAEAVKNFFTFLSEKDNFPLFYHCKIGTDRTGLCSVLLSGLLGVSLDEIYQDYLFSNFGKIGEKRGIGTGDSHDMLKYVDDLLTFSGASFKNKVYNVLLSIGLSRETLDGVISNLTEGPAPKGNEANQVIGRADALTPDGLEATVDDSDRKHPDTYYVLDSDSKSVSYSFDVSSAFSGQVVAYLGNSDASTSKKIGDAITCDIDGTPLTIRDVTYKDARMGKCTFGGSSRMNYFPVILGSADLSSGHHTIRIGGTSNTMNIGGIYIFDNATAGGSNGVN